MSDAAAENRLEQKLAEATLDYARARATVATIAELSGLHTDPSRLKAIAQEKLRALPAIEGDFYRVRRQLRQALRNGSVTPEHATAQISAWHERCLQLKETSAHVRELHRLQQVHSIDRDRPRYYRRAAVSEIPCAIRCPGPA